MTAYPPSTVAYPLLNQLLEFLLPSPVSSTSSTFTLPTVATPSSSSTSSSSTSSSSTSSSTPLQPTVASVTSTVFSSTSATSLPPISSFFNTTTPISSPALSSSVISPVSSINSSLFLHPKDAVATTPHFQQYSAVRQLTRDLQQKKPRHPKRPQLPSDGLGKPVRRLVRTVVYKQKLAKYIDALKIYEQQLDELIAQTSFELNKINNTLPPSKLTKFKKPQPKQPQLSPLSIQIPSHQNYYNYNNGFHGLVPHCSHVPVKYAIHSYFPPTPPPSPALILIRVEPISPSFQPPSPLNDLDNLITSLNDVD